MHLLHIITGKEQELTQTVIQTQNKNAGDKVEVIRLADTGQDYQRLLEKIFAADSVHVW